MKVKSRMFGTFAIIIAALTMLQIEPALAQSVIALDDQLDAYWVIEKKVAPKYPKKALVNEINGCAAVGYIIEPDGSTSNHKVLAYHPSRVFDKSAIRAAKKFRYLPSEQNPDKTSALTINVFTYQVSSSRNFNAETREELNEVCAKAAKEAIGQSVGG